MSPFVAGLALIPTTVPMVLLSTTVGRWYDRSGGRPPLVVGFGLLALSGLALGVGVHLLQPAAPNYFFLLPGLLVFGTGLAFVLTACDPVSLDSVDDRPRRPGRRECRPPPSRREGRSGSPGSTPSSTRSMSAASSTSPQRLDQRLTPHQGQQLRQALAGGRADRPPAPPLRPVVGPLSHSGLQRLQARVRRGVLLGAGGLGAGRPGCVASCPEASPSTRAAGRLNRLTATRDVPRLELGSCPRVHRRRCHHNGTVANIPIAPSCPDSPPVSPEAGCWSTRSVAKVERSTSRFPGPCVVLSLR